MKKQLKQAGTLLVFGIIVVLFHEYEWKQETLVTSEAQEQAEVVRIVDGDTIVVRIDDDDEKIRIIGINTPESVKPNSPVECFGEEASAYMRSLLQAGDFVNVSTDSTQDTRDRNGRLLAHVFFGDENIGEQMIQGGYAYEYTYRDPYIYQVEYKIAERDARNNNQGLWSSETCNGQK